MKSVNITKIGSLYRGFLAAISDPILVVPLTIASHAKCVNEKMERQ
jgi:hypothetical protein